MSESACEQELSCCKWKILHLTLNQIWTSLSCRREKNRIAARVSRARKAESLHGLQRDLANLRVANAELRQRVDQVSKHAEILGGNSAILKVAFLG